VVVTGGSARIVIHLTHALPMTECRLTIVNDLGQPLATLSSEVISPQDVRDPSAGPRIECDVDSMPFIPGRYRLDVVVKGRRQIQDGLEAATFFDVEPGIVAGRPVPVQRVEGDLFLAHQWRLPA
jgi:lipopolysaccharide transport system ATP-binding protein